MDICGAVVIPEGNPEAGFSGWGEENVPAIFRPLLTSPQVPLVQEQDKLDLSDIDGLDPQIAELIQEKARAKACLNRKHANRALHTYDGLFCQIYGSLANLVNVTSDNVCVYLRLISVTNYNQRRLVSSKMCSIIKPYMRWALNTNASDSSQGIFVGVSNVIKNLKETKEINMLVESSLL